MYDYKIEEGRKAHQGYAAFYEGLLCLLNGIKFVTKKDGTPYQNMAKNIDLSGVKGITNVNLTLRAIPYDLRGSNELHFWFRDKNEKYQEYNIRLKSDFDIENVEKERIIKEPCLTPYYNMTLEDLKKYIEDQKKKIQEWLDREKKLLANFDKAINMAKKFEQDFKAKYPDISLWYIIKESF
jgi:hypothetical protein